MSWGVWVSDDMRLKEFILVLHATTKEEQKWEPDIEKFIAVTIWTNLKFIAPHTSKIN